MMARPQFALQTIFSFTAAVGASLIAGPWAWSHIHGAWGVFAFIFGCLWAPAAVAYFAGRDPHSPRRSRVGATIFVLWSLFALVVSLVVVQFE